MQTSLPKATRMFNEFGSMNFNDQTNFVRSLYDLEYFHSWRDAEQLPFEASLYRACYGCRKPQLCMQTDLKA